MSAVVKQVNLITLKLDMLKDERRLFLETLDTYLNQAIYLGQSFVDNPSNSLLNFKDISLTVESALSFIGEKTAEFKSKLKEKSGLIGHELHSDFETSDSVSFEILQQSPSKFAELKTHSLQATDHSHERTEFLEKQLKSNSAKLETLSSTLIRVIADLNSLKRLGNGDGHKAQNAEGDGRVSIGLEQSETFVEIKKNYSSLVSDLESVSKRYEFIMKEFSANKCENGQQMNVLEKRLNDLESKGSKTEIRSADVENKLCRLEDSHSKMDHRINSLENRQNKMDNRLNETDTRVSQFELRTCAVIGEKEAEMRDITDRLRQTGQDILAIKQVTNERKEMDLAKLTEIEDCVKSLQKNCAKLDLEQRVTKLSEWFQKLDAEKRSDAKHIEEVTSVLDSIQATQDSLSTRLTKVEAQVKPKYLSLAQQAALMKVGARVKRGPHWVQGNFDGSPPGLGTIVLELAPYNMVKVKWDCGNEDNYTIGGYQNRFELQLADQP